MGRLVSEHLGPGVIRSLVENNPRLVELVGRVRSEHGLSEPRAKNFVTRLLTVVLDNFGETFHGELSARLDRIVSIRERITGVYDSVLAGRGLPEGTSVHEVEGLFVRLQSEMDALQSPSAAAADPRTQFRVDLPVDEVLPAPTGEARGRSGAADRPLAQVLEGQTAAFDQLPPKSRAALEDVAATHGDLVSRAIRAGEERTFIEQSEEIAFALSNEGKSPEQIRAVLDAIFNLNEARRREGRRARFGRGLPYDPSTPEGLVRLKAIRRFRERASRIRKRQTSDPNFIPSETELAVLRADQDPEFYAALRSNQDVGRLGYQSPDFLAELFGDYQGSESRFAFSTYLEGRLRSHIVGLVGEYTAAFVFGEELAFVKGPDFNVTEPGTDAVGIVKSNGEIWLTDNKALKAETVGSVSSLVDQILVNLERDANDPKIAATRANPQTPAFVREALSRHAEAAKAVRAYLKTNPGDIKSPGVQAEITRILADHRIRRVVTNAGGEVTGLTEALQNLGIELRNANR